MDFSISSSVSTGKSPKGSSCEMTQLVLPSHANTLGTIFGGQIMKWVDITASIAAMRHAENPVVTASIDALHFYLPVRIGEVVILKAHVNEAFHTSMEVEVCVEVENPTNPSLERKCTTKAFLTFVAIDTNGKPMAVPKIIAETEEEQKRQQLARIRRDIRKQSRASF